MYNIVYYTVVLLYIYYSPFKMLAFVINREHAINHK